MNIKAMNIMSFIKKRKNAENNLKLTPLMIIKRGDYLYHFSFWIYGLFYDIQLAGKSLNNTIINKSKDAYPVQSISYMYLIELVKQLKYNPEDVFVDVGCAWGRMLGYLRKKTTISKFYGVELNDEIAKQAKHFFEKDSKVEIISGNVLNNIPVDGTIFYLFNPFNADVLDAFLSALEKQIRHNVKVIYLHPTCSEIFEKHSDWKKIETIELMPKKMGKLEMFVYQKNFDNG